MKERKDEQDCFVVVRRNVIVKLNFDDILFFESQGRKIHVHTADDEQCFNGSLRGLLPALDDRFYLCHGSFIVNVTKIVRFEGAELFLEGGKSIPVSQRKKGATIRHFLDFCEQHFPCNSNGSIV